MAGKLIQKNILRNKLRSFLIIFPIAVVVMLFVSTSSIMAGVDKAIYARYEDKVQRTVLPVFLDNQSTDSGIFSDLGNLEGVIYASGSLFKTEQVNNESVFVKYVWPTTCTGCICLYWPLESGRLFNSTSEVIVDNNYFRSRHYSLGQKIRVGLNEYTITGTFNPWRGVHAQIVVPYFIDSYNLIEVVMNQVNFDAVESVVRNYPGFKTFRGGAVSSYFMKSSVLLSKSLNQVLVVIVIVVLLSLLNLINITIYERRKDIKLLLNIGMRQNQVLKSLFIEVFMLSIIGFLFGALGGITVPAILMAGFAVLTKTSIIWPIVTGDVLWNAFLISVGVGSVTAAYIGYKASRFKFEKRGMYV
jgi:cell division protein FtsX